MTVAAVVLAAGAGSRFRGDAHKLLAPLDGVPIVARSVAAALAGGLDEVIVVEGAVDLRNVLPEGVVRCVNPGWADGIASSLHAGIDRAAQSGHDAVVVGLGDQPFVSAGAWSTVGRSSIAPIVVATYDGKRRNPVRLHETVWPLLPAGGDEGARTLMRERPDLVGEVACEGIAADIDTVEDLAQWS